jgi:hypothetical protein
MSMMLLANFGSPALLKASKRKQKTSKFGVQYIDG